MKEMWDQRYSTDSYVYGTEPNEYFRKGLEGLQPGRILLPAEGEGRNAVHAARLGWEVSAFDQSSAGRNKALQLAAEFGVSIDYLLSEFEAVSYPEDSFDVVALIFAHFFPGQRREYHRRIHRSLKPGGTVILEGFSTRNLELVNQGKNAAGPKNADMLFTTDLIEGDFPDYEILELVEEAIHLGEGDFHNGTASVIRFTGRKPPV